MRLIEKFDPTEKQANRIYMLVRNMSQNEVRDIISTSETIQDIFDALKDVQPSNDFYIDLRNYKNIPPNAIHQFDKENYGFWFRVDRGEWFFVKDTRLADFKALWNDKGEIIFPHAYEEITEHDLRKRLKQCSNRHCYNCENKVCDIISKHAMEGIKAILVKEKTVEQVNKELASQFHGIGFETGIPELEPF